MYVLDIPVGWNASVALASGMCKGLWLLLFPTGTFPTSYIPVGWNASVALASGMCKGLWLLLFPTATFPTATFPSGTDVACVSGAGRRNVLTRRYGI